MVIPSRLVAVRHGLAVPTSARLVILVMWATASPIARGSMLQAAEPCAVLASPVDGDFAYQGEYVGDVRAVCGTIVPFGLQVVALAWQTYDIYFRAPRWDDQARKRRHARITVMHNGVPVHQDRDILTKTGAGEPEGPQPRPIRLQFHGDPVEFRNVWLVTLNERADACDPYAKRPNVTRHMASPCAPVPVNWHTSSRRN